MIPNPRLFLNSKYTGALLDQYDALSELLDTAASTNQCLRLTVRFHNKFNRTLRFVEYLSEIGTGDPVDA